MDSATCRLDERNAGFRRIPWLLKEDLGAAEVYVFTPKGKIVSLPAEATPD